MMVENMNRRELEVALIENDIVDVMEIEDPDKVPTETIRKWVTDWVLESDETQSMEIA